MKGIIRRIWVPFFVGSWVAMRIGVFGEKKVEFSSRMHYVYHHDSTFLRDTASWVENDGKTFVVVKSFRPMRFVRG